MNEQLPKGPLAKMFGPSAADHPTDYRVQDLELRLNVVRQQRDEAVQQLLDERATVSLLRRKLGQRTDGIGYCDSTFTPPDGVDTLTCALDAGHSTNLHHDAGNTWAWTTDGGQVVGIIDGGVRCGRSGTNGPCVRPESHDGLHSDRHGGVWANTCGVTRSVGNRPTDVCSRAPGHTGPCVDGRTGVAWDITGRTVNADGVAP
ncbi:hypothetical protein SEA_SALVADOR_64 [Gordonia phage Salvador]|uniref:Uncharacterized protein n=1 Tax=Gordonia phage Evamon TaxID=2725634 RepID=A0A6M3T0N8_9CAUD|nr:hypothetical protein KNV01_gp64 [Gordonia phage Evamon]QJD51559.1 hypothetical protein SEA_EVAMON_64 [Gordonia phage Evamon]UVK62386.1 hypothetical protein SEA_SALVADOR_64 [Gordonia phage Salvador]